MNINPWRKNKEILGDDPPYLPVGTEVSARYKGAFCEAKIKKINKNVRCKVEYKIGGKGVVSDDQIKGILMAGASVEVRQSEKKENTEATIVKIQDMSQYTVMFDDGDIATLRRAALCLKSGRYFSDCATLDHLPLTNPERFSSPVLAGTSRSRRRQNDESSDEEVYEEKNKIKEKDMGKVVCVELADKKKTKRNWFPGLIVAPNSQDTVKINAEQEYLVRSFKDGRYYTVPKKETIEFTRQLAVKVENPTLKAAVEKAIAFLDKDELPPHWDRDILFGNIDYSLEDDSNSSDDEPREDKDHFVAQLYKFMDDRGTPINTEPVISSRDVDIYKLYKVVNKLGGYNRVTNRNQWKFVASKLGFSASHTNSVKLTYKRYLHSFEDFYRKLGCTLLNNPKSNRLPSRYSRPLIRDRDKSLIATDKIVEKEQIKEKEKELVVSVPNGSKNNNGKTNGKSNSSERSVTALVNDSEPRVKSKSESSDSVTVESDKKKEALKLPSKKPNCPTIDRNDLLNKLADTGVVTKSVELEAKSSGGQNSSSGNSGIVGTIKKPLKRLQKVLSDTDLILNNKSRKAAASSSSAEDGGSPKSIQQQKKTSFKERLKAVVNKIKSNAKLNDNAVSEVAAAVVTETPKSSNKINENEEKKSSVCTENTTKNTPQLKSKSKDDNVSKLPPNAAVSSPSVPEDNQNCVKSDNKVNVDLSATKLEPKVDEKRVSFKRKKDDDDSSMNVIATNRIIHVGDKLKVYYGPTQDSKVTYEAKVTKIKKTKDDKEYLVHYTGWNTRYDEWITRNRIADNLTRISTRGRKKGSSTDKVASPSEGNQSVKTTDSSRINGSSSSSMSTSSSSSNVSDNKIADRATRSSHQGGPTASITAKEKCSSFKTNNTESNARLRSKIRSARITTDDDDKEVGKSATEEGKHKRRFGNKVRMNIKVADNHKRSINKGISSLYSMLRGGNRAVVRKPQFRKTRKYNDVSRLVLKNGKCCDSCIHDVNVFTKRIVQLPTNCKSEDDLDNSNGGLSKQPASSDNSTTVGKPVVVEKCNDQVSVEKSSKALAISDSYLIDSKRKISSPLKTPTAVQASCGSSPMKTPIRMPEWKTKLSSPDVKSANVSSPHGKHNYESLGSVNSDVKFKKDRATLLLNSYLGADRIECTITNNNSPIKEGGTAGNLSVTPRKQDSKDFVTAMTGTSVISKTPGVATSDKSSTDDVGPKSHPVRDNLKDDIYEFTEPEPLKLINAESKKSPNKRSTPALLAPSSSSSPLKVIAEEGVSRESNASIAKVTTVVKTINDTPGITKLIIKDEKGEDKILSTYLLSSSIIPSSSNKLNENISKQTKRTVVPAATTTTTITTATKGGPLGAGSTVQRESSAEPKAIADDKFFDQPMSNDDAIVTETSTIINDDQTETNKLQMAGASQDQPLSDQADDKTIQCDEEVANILRKGNLTSETKSSLSDKSEENGRSSVKTIISLSSIGSLSRCSSSRSCAQETNVSVSPTPSYMSGLSGLSGYAYLSNCRYSPVSSEDGDCSSDKPLYICESPTFMESEQNNTLDGGSPETSKENVMNNDTVGEVSALDVDNEQPSTVAAVITADGHNAQTLDDRDTNEVSAVAATNENSPDNNNAVDSSDAVIHNSSNIEEESFVKIKHIFDDEQSFAVTSRQDLDEPDTSNMEVPVAGVCDNDSEKGTAISGSIVTDDSSNVEAESFVKVKHILINAQSSSTAADSIQVTDDIDVSSAEVPVADIYENDSRTTVADFTNLVIDDSSNIEEESFITEAVDNEVPILYNTNENVQNVTYGPDNDDKCFTKNIDIDCNNDEEDAVVCQTDDDKYLAKMPVCSNNDDSTRDSVVALNTDDGGDDCLTKITDDDSVDDTTEENIYCKTDGKQCLTETTRNADTDGIENNVVDNIVDDTSRQPQQKSAENEKTNVEKIESEDTLLSKINDSAEENEEDEVEEEEEEEEEEEYEEEEKNESIATDSRTDTVDSAETTNGEEETTTDNELSSSSDSLSTKQEDAAVSCDTSMNKDSDEVKDNVSSAADDSKRNEIIKKTFVADDLLCKETLPRSPLGAAANENLENADIKMKERELREMLTASGSFDNEKSASSLSNDEAATAAKRPITMSDVSDALSQIRVLNKTPPPGTSKECCSSAQSPSCSSTGAPSPFITQARPKYHEKEGVIRFGKFPKRKLSELSLDRTKYDSVVQAKLTTPDGTLQSQSEESARKRMKMHGNEKPGTSLDTSNNPYMRRLPPLVSANTYFTELDTMSTPELRLAFLEKTLQELRTMYLTIKKKLGAIDKRAKKLRRKRKRKEKRQLEKAARTQNNDDGNSATNYGDKGTSASSGATSGGGVSSGGVNANKKNKLRKGDDSKQVENDTDDAGNSGNYRKTPAHATAKGSSTSSNSVGNKNDKNTNYGHTRKRKYSTSDEKNEENDDATNIAKSKSRNSSRKTKSSGASTNLDGNSSTPADSTDEKLPSNSIKSRTTTSCAEKKDFNKTSSDAEIVSGSNGKIKTKSVSNVEDNSTTLYEVSTIPDKSNPAAAAAVAGKLAQKDRAMTSADDNAGIIKSGDSNASAGNGNNNGDGKREYHRSGYESKGKVKKKSASDDDGGGGGGGGGDTESTDGSANTSGNVDSHRKKISSNKITVKSAASASGATSGRSTYNFSDSVNLPGRSSGVKSV